MMSKTNNGIYGMVESSLNYSKQQLSNKNVSEEQKIAYRRIRDHFDYYLNKQVDQDFLRQMISYHFMESLKRAELPKTVLTSDKVQSKIANNEITVLMRLAEI